MTYKTIRVPTDGCANLRNGYSVVTAILVEIDDREARIPPEVEIRVENSRSRRTNGKMIVRADDFRRLCLEVLLADRESPDSVIGRLLRAARCALADLEGIIPDLDSDGDRAYPAWETMVELRAAIEAAGETWDEASGVWPIVLGDSPEKLFDDDLYCTCLEWSGRHVEGNFPNLYVCDDCNKPLPIAFAGSHEKVLVRAASLSSGGHYDEEEGEHA